MIIFKCNCGKVLAVQSLYAGREITCPDCHETLIAPAASEPDYYMVFSDGYPSEGYPMSVNEIKSKITAGLLTNLDLIFYKNEWYPLSTVFDLPQEVDTVTQNLESDELALYLTEMPPLNGFLPLPAEYVSNDKRKQRGDASKFVQKVLSPQTWSASSWNNKIIAINFKNYKKSQLALFISIALIVLLIFAFFATFGWNKLLHRSTNVILCNSNDNDVIVQIPFFHKSVSAPKGVSTISNLTFAFPIHVAILADDELITANLPIKANQDIIINLNCAYIFGEYKDYPDIGAWKYSSSDFKTLIQQISNNEIPTVAPRVIADIHNSFSRNFYVGDLSSEIISSDNYNFLWNHQDINVKIIPDNYSLENNFLLYPKQQNVKFTNGTLDFDPNVEHNTCSLVLPQGCEFYPDSQMPDFVIDGEMPTITFTMTGRYDFKLTMIFKNNYERQVGNMRNIKTQWRYEASFKNNKAVSCQWVYSFVNNANNKSEIVIKLL